MDAVISPSRRRAVRTACALAALLALAPAAAAEGAAAPLSAAPPPASPPPPADPSVLLRAAEDAAGRADFDKVRDLAVQALAALDQQTAEQAGQPEAARTRARVLDLAAQAYYNLGDKAAMGSAIEQLLAVDPGHAVDAAGAGPKFAELFEERRRKLVGRLVPTCAPRACEFVRIDGRPATPDAEGSIAVLAGTRTVVLGRRNFREQVLDAVVVAPGDVTPVQATLEQVARDVTLSTKPPGVRVLLDGKEIAATAPGADSAGASLPLVAPSLAPGPHVLVLQAPCFRRLEQTVDVVLDAQNLQPQDLGLLSLEKARATLEVNWDGPSGSLAVDGQPASSGKVELCPGAREVSLSLGGRRVWFETVDLSDGETRAVAPRPRPTAAFAGDDGAGGLAGFPGKAWNIVPLTAPAAESLSRAVSERRPATGAPTFPVVVRFAATGLAALAHAAAPEADVVVLRLAGLDPLRRVETLALVDTRRDIVELASWADKDAKTAAEVGDELVRAPRWGSRVAGFDIAEREGRGPVIAAVLPESAAASAGLAAGQVLLAVDGKPFAGGIADLDRLVANLAPDAPLVVKVALPAGEEKELRFTPPTTVDAPSPAVLRTQPGLLLLSLLAKAGVARLTGAPLERASAGVFEGLGLAALGLDADAAAGLDRASIDEAVDPAQDARATVAFVLERLLRKLGRADYAAEVRARWRPYTAARLGGRGGPPLRAAPQSPED